MSYALGQAQARAVPSNIKIGHLARRDPIVAFASVMTSDLLRQASLLAPRGTRLEWLRTEINKAQPRLGCRAAAKVRELRRRGESANQALFDGVRLTLANQIAMRMDKIGPRHSAAGLGDSASDINAVFCGVIGVGTAGGAIAASFDNPGSSQAIGQAGASAMLASGCNQGALAEQARIAEANAMAAQANASAAVMLGQQATDNTLLYVGLGVGGLLLVGGLGFVALRKK